MCDDGKGCRREIIRELSSRQSAFPRASETSDSHEPTLQSSLETMHDLSIFTNYRSFMVSGDVMALNDAAFSPEIFNCNDCEYKNEYLPPR